MIFQNFLKGLLHWLLCNMKALTDGCTVKFKLSSNNILKMKQKARKTWAKKSIWQFNRRLFYANAARTVLPVCHAYFKDRCRCKNGRVWPKWMCLKYKRGNDTALARLNIRPFFTAPRCYALAQCPLFLFLLSLSIRGAALIKNELALLPLVYLKWMRAARVGAYLSPPDLHGTLWRTGRAKMQNFSSWLPPPSPRFNCFTYAAMSCADNFCTSSIKRNGRDIFHRPGTGG